MQVSSCALPDGRVYPGWSICGLELELCGQVTIRRESAPHDLDALPELFHEAVSFECFGQSRISIICEHGMTNALRCNRPKRTPRAQDFNTVRVPGHSDRCVCPIITSMHHSISNKLLKRTEWIVTCSNVCHRAHRQRR